MKKGKVKQSHTSSAKYGMGDYFGSGVKQKVGRARDIMGISPKSKKLKVPPTSVV